MTHTPTFCQGVTEGRTLVAKLLECPAQDLLVQRPALLDGFFMRGELMGAVELVIHAQNGKGAVLLRPDQQLGAVAIGQSVLPEHVGAMFGVGVFHGRPGAPVSGGGSLPSVIDQLVGLRHEPQSVYTTPLLGTDSDVMSPAVLVRRGHAPVGHVQLGNRSVLPSSLHVVDPGPAPAPHS